MDLRRLIFPIHKWWWLVVTTTLLGALAAFIAVQGQPTLYQARVTLLVGGTINDPNPTGTDIVAGESLANAYAEIANREGVSSATKAALDLPVLPNYTAAAIPRTSFVEIIVTDRSPLRAQTVANELAEQLIQISPTRYTAEEQLRITIVNQQLDQIETDILSTQADIDETKASLATLDSAQTIGDAQAKLSALQSTMNTLNTTYASLLASTRDDAINRLTVIEPAALPTEPVGFGKFITVLLAATIGLALAVSAVYLIEYGIDNSVKFPDEVEAIFDKPIIGYIYSTTGIRKNTIPISKYTTHPTAEAFRSLKTNLLFMGSNGSTPRTILAASPDKLPGKGKFVINLALALAEGGKRVILVDADLRVPDLHTHFNLNGKPGLAEILTQGLRPEDVMLSMQRTVFRLIVAGQDHAEAVQWLDSDRMDNLIDCLKSISDIVVFNSPPYFVADTAILGSKVDGVLAVIHPNVSSRGTAGTMAEQIKRSGANLLGVTMIEIPNWGARYLARTPNQRYYTA
jgi:capsular exopolysaccharide synthesis family protein